METAQKPHTNTISVEKSSITSSSRVKRSIVKGEDTHRTRPVVGSEEWHQLRRENHKRVERKRRETINEQIAQLAKLLPKCEKTNKGAILKEAVLYMENMRQSNELIKQLQQQVEELKRENSQLKCSLAAEQRHNIASVKNQNV